MSNIPSNGVWITAPMVTAMTYVEGSFHITDGEGYELPPNIVSPSGTNGWQILLSAQRKASSSVAADFASLAGGTPHEFAPGQDAAPKELNFCYGINMTFQINASTTTMVTLYLAQGSYLATNNWWIGGANLTRNDEDSATLVVGSGSNQMTITVTGNTGLNANQFTFTQS